MCLILLKRDKCYAEKRWLSQSTMLPRWRYGVPEIGLLKGKFATYTFNVIRITDVIRITNAPHVVSQDQSNSRLPPNSLEMSPA